MKTLLQLVGAGPGDPELITLKAVKAISGADVILYDALANESLLQYSRPDAIREYVGKRFGCQALSQQEINQRMVDYATRYPHIVRLKGGDPFVFGRAAEEMQTALENGMEVEVIPGVSSAIAVPASQMIPLTSRGINESFWVTTGTTQEGKTSQDLYLAAQSSSTIIILMAMSKLEEIMDIFISYGKAETPVAIIQNGTLPNAKIAVGKVKDIVSQSHHKGLSNPSVIVIGEVVRLRGDLLNDIAKNCQP